MSMKTRDVFRIARLNLRITKWHKPPVDVATGYCFPVYEANYWGFPAEEWRKKHLVPTKIPAKD